MVEAALGLPLILGVLLTSVDLTRVVFMQATLNNAVARGARYASLAFVEPDQIPDPLPSDWRSNTEIGVSSVREVIQHIAGLPIEPADFRICLVPTSAAACSSGEPNRRGAAERWIYLQASTRTSLVMGALPIELTARAVANNENFPRPRALEYLPNHSIEPPIDPDWPPLPELEDRLF